MIRAGRDARDLYLAGLCYCGEGLTDGHIPAGALRILAAEADIDDPANAAAALLREGLWEYDANGDYVVHHYLDYNPPRERVEATREVRAAAGSRGGKQRASNVKASAKQTASKLLEAAQAVASDNGQAKANPVPVPVPVQTPVENAPAGEGARSRATPPPSPAQDVPVFVPPRAGKTPMPEDWEPSDEDRAFARQCGMTGRDIAHNAAKCRAHYRAHGEYRDNWSEVWRLWVLREIEGGPGAPRLPPLELHQPDDLTEAERAAEAENRAELERRRQEYLSRQPSAHERLLQKARDDPERPDYVAPEIWMTWDTAMKRANSPATRRRLSKKT